MRSVTTDGRNTVEGQELPTHGGDWNAVAHLESRWLDPVLRHHLEARRHSGLGWALPVLVWVLAVAGRATSRARVGQSFRPSHCWTPPDADCGRCSRQHPSIANHAGACLAVHCVSVCLVSPPFFLAPFTTTSAFPPVPATTLFSLLHPVSSRPELLRLSFSLSPYPVEDMGSSRAPSHR